MHFHVTQANANGNALAAAQAAETSQALRRARELKEAAAKLKAASLDIASELAADPAADPATMAQTAFMIQGWSGSHAGQDRSASSPLDPPDSVQRSTQIQPTQAGRPISFWA